MKEIEIQQEETASTMLQVIEKAALSPNVDVDKMKAMLDMQERVMAKQAEIDFNNALADMQPELPMIKKSAKAHNSKYAKYEDIEKAIRPKNTKHGFSVTFDVQQEGDVETYIGYLKHRGGHFTSATMVLPADTSGSKNAIQAKGSSSSYARRYLIGMLLNIVTCDEDNDGNQVKFISGKQAEIIDEMIDESGSDREEFLKYCGINAVENLPANKFNKVKGLLQKKIEANV